MTSLFVLLWVAIVALQLADVTLSAAGIGRARGTHLPLLDALQDARGQRHTPEEVAEFRARLAELDALTDQQERYIGLGATGWLWRRSPARLLFVFFSSALVLLLWLITLTSVLLLLLVVLPVTSYLLALAAARASVAAAATARVENSRQRREIVALLDEAAKLSRGKTAGLGDRVARALQILREQQATNA